MMFSQPQEDLLHIVVPLGSVAPGSRSMAQSHDRCGGSLVVAEHILERTVLGGDLWSFLRFGTLNMGGTNPYGRKESRWSGNSIKQIWWKTALHRMMLQERYWISGECSNNHGHASMILTPLDGRNQCEVSQWESRTISSYALADFPVSFGC